MLWVLSAYIDYAKYEQLKLKDIFQYIFPSSSQMNEILKDLKLRMVKRDKDYNPILRHPEINNIFAFEAYLYCLKRWIINFINNGVKRRDLDQESDIVLNMELYKPFEFIEELSKSSDTNKYYCGRSTGLIELVEYMFMTKIESEKYSKEIQIQIMKNRMEIVEKFSQPILNWLMISLPYHTESPIMKRYIKIITNLMYSIRESGSSNVIKNTEEFHIKLLDDERIKIQNDTPKGK